MSRQSQRALVASLMMILASLAGCLGTDDSVDDDTSTESLGTVIASTYHVEQLASAVGGDLVSVEMMSTMNVPVHDYEPSAQDIIRLNQADVFFYHGLGLEPWVEGALANLESDGPVAVGTHAMPSGETALDFESLLIDNLCTSMTEPATTDVHLLAEHAEDADELHSDDGGHNLAFPEDDHDEDGHDEDGDEHGEEHHVCHDLTTHENHDEYTTEEECEAAGHSWMEDAHADEEGPVCHDEDTHENHDEYETEEACEAAGYHWMEDDHDGHGDHDDEMTPEEAMSAFDENNDSSLSWDEFWVCLLYTSPSPRDRTRSRMPSSA